MRKTTWLPLSEILDVDIYRAKPFGYSAKPDETREPGDLIVTTGRNFLAGRISNVTGTGSGMWYMAVGTVTGASSLGNTTLSGEIKRKVNAVSSATANLYTMVCTFGGAADTIQSVAITEAGVFNHASSGLGVMFQRVDFAGVTLADSDLLSVTLQTNVGSS